MAIDRLLQDGGVPIEIRVGVNTGEVVMRPLKTGDSNTEYAPIGLTTNLVSCLENSRTAALWARSGYAAKVGEFRERARVPVTRT